MSVTSITLVAQSYFGGKAIVRFDETGASLVSDDRSTKDGYLHFEDCAPSDPPSEELKRTLANYFVFNATEPVTNSQLSDFRDERGWALDPGFGHPVCKWAFVGETADSLSQKYGTGKKVYLA